MTAPTTHAYPPPGATTTPCCGRQVNALPIGDRLSSNVERVTCEGAK